MGWLNCISCIYCVTTETGMVIGCERNDCDEWRDEDEIHNKGQGNRDADIRIQQ